MIILHFASVSDNKASGLSFSVPNLIKSQNLKSNINLTKLYNTNFGIKLQSIDFKIYDTYVLHSFFILDYIKLLIKLPRNKKIIICPRGAFSLSNRYSLKKKIYAFIYFSVLRIRKINYSIHFLTINEKKRSRFKTKSDFIVGNTIEIKNNNKLNDVSFFQEKFRNKKIIYIGRFSNHIKGLDRLFNFLVSNKETIENNNLKFSFYGPESIDKSKLKLIVEGNKLSFISFYPEIYGFEKERVYSESMFHILSSRSEGFPMSVLESVSFYTPQILSYGTNLQEKMERNNFGLSFEDSFLDKLIELNFTEYLRMCKNARLFGEEHDLSIIGNQTIQFYLK